MLLGNFQLIWKIPIKLENNMPINLEKKFKTDQKRADNLPPRHVENGPGTIPVSTVALKSCIFHRSIIYNYKRYEFLSGRLYLRF